MGYPNVIGLQGGILFDAVPDFRRINLLGQA